MNPADQVAGHNHHGPDPCPVCGGIRPDQRHPNRVLRPPAGLTAARAALRATKDPR